MTMPEGVCVEKLESKACKLLRSLYGLKQSPRLWYLRSNEYITSNQFVRSKYDYWVYIKLQNNVSMFLLLYVDDMLVANNAVEGIREVKKMMSSKFEMKDLGEAKTIIGMQIKRHRHTGMLKLNQQLYLKKVLSRYNMIVSKSVTTPI